VPSSSASSCQGCAGRWTTLRSLARLCRAGARHEPTTAHVCPCIISLATVSTRLDIFVPGNQRLVSFLASYVDHKWITLKVSISTLPHRHSPLLTPSPFTDGRVLLGQRCGVQLVIRARAYAPPPHPKPRPSLETSCSSKAKRVPVQPDLQQAEQDAKGSRTALELWSGSPGGRRCRHAPPAPLQPARNRAHADPPVLRFGCWSGHRPPRHRRKVRPRWLTLQQITTSSCRASPSLLTTAQLLQEKVSKFLITKTLPKKQYLKVWERAFQHHFRPD